MIEIENCEFQSKILITKTKVKYWKSIFRYCLLIFKTFLEKTSVARDEFIHLRIQYFILFLLRIIDHLFFISIFNIYNCWSRITGQWGLEAFFFILNCSGPDSLSLEMNSAINDTGNNYVDYWPSTIIWINIEFLVTLELINNQTWFWICNMHM